jgi:hypothetical protein
VFGSGITLPVDRQLPLRLSALFSFLRNRESGDHCHVLTAAPAGPGIFNEVCCSPYPFSAGLDTGFSGVTLRKAILPVLFR